MRTLIQRLRAILQPDIDMSSTQILKEVIVGQYSITLGRYDLKSRERPSHDTVRPFSKERIIGIPLHADAANMMAVEGRVLNFANWYRAQSLVDPSSYPGCLTATDFYEAYCTWCEERAIEPCSIPTCSRTVSEVFDKHKLGGRVYYELRSTSEPKPNSLAI